MIEEQRQRDNEKAVFKAREFKIRFKEDVQSDLASPLKTKSTQKQTTMPIEV